VRDIIDSGEAPGPRLLVSGAPITTTSGHLHWCGLTADTEDEVRIAVRRMVEAGADFIKVMATGGGMTPMSNARMPQYSKETLTALVQDANRLNKRVAAHTLAADGCEYAVDAGVNTFEHFRWMTNDGIDYRPDAIDRLNPETQSINATFTGYDRNRFADFDSFDAMPSESIVELRDQYEIYRDAAGRGASVTASSDAGVANAEFADFALSVIAGMVALDDTAAGAIRRATSSQAKALGLESEIGSIETGKRADLLVVERDASKNIFALRNPIAVYRNGREVASGGRLHPATVPSGSS
ncbi:MAG: amidohydrolase family protein, partial [Gammaproteobacteria bacterium]|nr:amidohydrolase family protein [Gammaproteobacteria bacterium]